MGENPDKYDYSKAQVRKYHANLYTCTPFQMKEHLFLTLAHLKVPGPLTAEIESKKAEKKKAQNAIKKQREKGQKEEKRKQELEAEEKKRFASLTDREKVSYSQFITDVHGMIKPLEVLTVFSLVVESSGR